MPVVDVSFPIRGERIPVDHGYALYSALTRLAPYLHEEKNELQCGIHPIRGRLLGNRELAITKESQVVIRIPSEKIIDILPIAGKSIALNEMPLSLGVPQARTLLPAPKLAGRLVVMKGYVEEEAFLGAVQKKLDEMGISAKVKLILRDRSRSFEGKHVKEGGRSKFVRRTIEVKGSQIVGFAVVVEGLSPEESIFLQERGLGGRRRMGCGIFCPTRA